MAEETKRGEWDYDLILVGTSLKECFLSGILAAVDKKKILHLDRNDYYGGESASFNMTQLVQKFKGADAKVAPALARDRSSDYSIDASPKFLMACDMLCVSLQKLIPEDYLTFQGVMGSYVYHERGLHKVPSTAKEGLGSSLLGMMQKIHFRSFINFVVAYEHADVKTHDAKIPLDSKTMAEVYKYFSLDAVSQTFISHAMALEPDNKHLTRPALPIIQKIKLYGESMLRFGNSPYIYPNYGLGGLAESFSRLSSIYGCTFITGCDIKSIDYHADGKFAGVSFNHHATGDIKATGTQIIGDPSYFPADMSTKISQIARSICILDRQVPNSAENCQIIIPGNNCGRQSDIYISALSEKQKVCPRGRFVAVVSSAVDGANITDLDDKKACTAVCDRELKQAYGLFPQGSVLERFDWVTELRSPASDTKARGVFMTQSFDATTHFISVMDEIFDVYHKVSGTPFNINALRSTADLQREEQLRAEAAAAAAQQTS